MQLPCFARQKMNIDKVEKSLIRTIKRMLKITIYTNTKTKTEVKLRNLIRG